MDVDPILFPLVAVLTDGARRKRRAERARRQLRAEEYEAAAEERDPVSHAEDDTSRVVEPQEGGQSTAGSAYNPEDPHHVSAHFSQHNCLEGSRAGECLINCEEAYTEPSSNP